VKAHNKISSNKRVAVQVSSMLLRRCVSTSKLPLTIRQLLSSLQATDQKTNVQVNGWIKSVRRQKNVTFAVINDGSCASGLQAVLKSDVTPHKYVFEAF
jgi:asparaginyl-tRNA synthetase